MPALRTAGARLARLAAAIGLLSGVMWHQGSALVSLPLPHEGSVTDGRYINKYFNISYPVPAGWTEGLEGPPPSESGYYVLGTLVPVGELTGTILIAAQDTFFADKTFSDAPAMAEALARAMSEIEGMTVEGPMPVVRIAGRSFSRVDFSGVGLFRSTLITEIRCHLVSFNLVARSPEALAGLVASLNDLADAPDRGAGSDPVCLRNRAEPRLALTKVDPAPVAPMFVPIPVRLIIAADGGVRQVHVIRATAAQRTSIESALGQWKFNPPEVEGRPADIETGLVVRFTPEGHVKYSTGDGPRQF